ncbi:MAG: class III poly(R)-hydroxyalkanoic acid synthase subunit PhaC [Actinomycetota bacterium]|nr:class III poly(R)-hydroxyalkanoic acid synthase subunit PhaC [Actinomycetota bacterium]
MIREFTDPNFFIQELEDINRKLVKGAQILGTMSDVEVEPTPKEKVLEEDKMQLYHYVTGEKPRCSVPLIICYALVNRQYMMDLQSDRSLIRNLLGQGLDIYIIDWGYPDHGDRYLTMEDYIDIYLNDCVDYVREKTGHDRINLLGVCQGGTFVAIYTALYPEKIRNMITMVAPVDFNTTDGLLNVWSRHMNIDNMVDTMGIIPGEFMNVGFLMLKPFQLMVDKYVGLMDNLDDPATVANFVRMEKWIFDSPAQAGEAYRKFLKDLYQENKLVKGELEIGGRRVDLKKITIPLLNIYATEDHLVPPACSIPLNDLVGSDDKTLYSFPGGHIGIYVSSRSQKELAPKVSQWLIDRCPRSGGKEKASAAAGDGTRSKAAKEKKGKRS